MWGPPCIWFLGKKDLPLEKSKVDKVAQDVARITEEGLISRRRRRRDTANKKAPSTTAS